MTEIDGHIYVQGHRTAAPARLADAAEALGDQDAVAWIALRDSSATTMEEAADLFWLHPLAVEDALEGHQRAKLERYGETMFVVLRPGSYDDGLTDTETVTVGPAQVVAAPDTIEVLTRDGSNWV